MIKNSLNKIFLAAQWKIDDKVLMNRKFGKFDKEWSFTGNGYLQQGADMVVAVAKDSKGKLISQTMFLRN